MCCSQPHFGPLSGVYGSDAGRVFCGRLMNYKLYIDGKLASTGPGRGEAPVVGGDGRFRAQPYVTVDLTPCVVQESFLGCRALLFAWQC